MNRSGEHPATTLLSYFIAYIIPYESSGRASPSCGGAFLRLVRGPPCLPLCGRPLLLFYFWNTINNIIILKRELRRRVPAPGAGPAVPSVRTTFIIIILFLKYNEYYHFQARAAAARCRALCGARRAPFARRRALRASRFAPSAAPERNRRRARQMERYAFAQYIQMCRTNGKFSSEPLLPFGPADGAEPAALYYI